MSLPFSTAGVQEGCWLVMDAAAAVALGPDWLARICDWPWRPGLTMRRPGGRAAARLG